MVARAVVTALALSAARFGLTAHIPARAEAPPGIPVSSPVELRVPAAGIDAAVQRVGLEADGSMGIPTNFDDAAWFSYGYKPGENGHAVFDGHVSSTDAAAVFFHVEELKPGASIYVTGDDGSVLTFRVTAVASYPLDGTPIEAIFGGADWPELVLITCSGQWHPDDQLFDRRTVVYASLVSSPAA